MKKFTICLVMLFFSISAHAGPSSVLGAKPLPDSSVHHVGVGWPSVAYEWWNAGSPDWAISAEMVYGDWSGEFSDVDIGAALNVPFRWQLKQNGRAHVALEMAPGGLIGSNDAPGGDLFVFGLRAEMGVPVSIDLNDRISFLTGVSAPFSVMFVESADPYVVIPLMPRLGVEFAVDESIAPFLLVELGPTIAVGDFGTEVELGLRSWIGVDFW